MDKIEKKHHYVYLIVFTETGEWYIGVHSCNRLGPDGFDPRYFSSGVEVRERKNEPHTREIVSRHRSRRAAELRESKEIGDSYDTDPLCLNKRSGGLGGVGTHCAKTRRRMRDSQKRYHRENPDAGPRHGEKIKKFYNDNPEARTRARETAIKQFASPESREESRIRGKAIWSDPDLRKKQSERQIARFQDPSIRDMHRAAMKKYFKDNPGASDHISVVKKRYFRETPGAIEKNRNAVKNAYDNNPEIRVRISAARKETDARRRKNGIPLYNSKQVLANDMPFLSQSDAAKGVGVDIGTIRRRIRNGVDGYRIISFDEYRDLVHSAENANSSTKSHGPHAVSPK